MIPGFIAELLLILVAARVGGRLARYAGQPAVVGEITAGVLLGQVGFGLFTHTEALSAVGQIGLILFLFLVGLRLDLTKLHTTAGWLSQQVWSASWFPSFWVPCWA